ncbi:hypothetical protein DFJ77DRAFT_463605 [Powellomyces hirtus]|nr:hypothetical protein DFJ77DRAFT_463605 [Powellomyces hirtus]
MTLYPFDDPLAISEQLQYLTDAPWWQAIRGLVLVVAILGIFPNVLLLYLTAAQGFLRTPSNILLFWEGAGCLGTLITHTIFLLPQYFPNLRLTSAGGATESDSWTCQAQGFLFVFASLQINSSCLAMCRERRARCVHGIEPTVKNCVKQCVIAIFMGMIVGCIPWIIKIPYAIQPAMFYCLPDYYQRNVQTRILNGLAFFAAVAFLFEAVWSYRLILKKLRDSQREMLHIHTPVKAEIVQSAKSDASHKSEAAGDTQDTNLEMNAINKQIADRIEIQIIRRGIVSAIVQCSCSIPFMTHLLTSFFDYEIPTWFSSLEGFCKDVLRCTRRCKVANSLNFCENSTAMVLNATLHGIMPILLDMPMRKAALTLLRLENREAAFNDSEVQKDWHSVDPGSMSYESDRRQSWFSFTAPSRRAGNAGRRASSAVGGDGFQPTRSFGLDMTDIVDPQTVLALPGHPLGNRCVSSALSIRHQHVTEEEEEEV